jgi:hypothetical protein
MFTYGGAPEEYNFAEVTFGSYLAILRFFLGNGLTADDIDREKKQILYHYAIPRFGRTSGQLMGFEETFKKYYQEEPYYEEALAIIRSIR